MKFDVLIDRIINESGVIKLRGKSKNPKDIEYKDIVYSWGKINPYNDREVLIDNNCLLKLQVSFNSVYIELGGEEQNELSQTEKDLHDLIWLDKKEVENEGVECLL